MQNVAFLVCLAAIVGVFKPYINNIKRWHFGLAAVVSFALIGVLAPHTKSNITEKKDAEQKSIGADAKTGVKTFYDSVLSEARSCDNANEKVITALKNGSLYDSYSSAKSAQSICQNSWMNINGFPEISGLDDKQTEKAKKAKQVCYSAYSARSRSLKALMVALDEGMKPSQLESYKEESQMAQSGVIACVSDLMGLTDSVGLKIEDLK